MVKFFSEPGLEIEADRFRLKEVKAIDSDTGAEIMSVSVWGHEPNTCAWFFVPLSEVRRLKLIELKMVDN